MDRSAVYMLASDHRWQWEEWCDGAGVPRPRIAEVKRLVLRAFLAAREQSGAVRRHGALLLDDVYGAEAVREARALGLVVGTPVERAGRFPLEWQDEPFHAGLAGSSFAKVLIRYRPQWPAEARAAQLDKLLALQEWCAAHDMPLLVEVIIMREAEDPAAFDAEGRPRLLAEVVRDAYACGLVPAFWKIEATPSREGAAIIDAAIRGRSEPRQLILGKGADARTIARWFAAAARLPSTAGFAIGRSVFWEPCTLYLLGRRGPAEVVRDMATRYLDLIASWRRYQEAAPVETIT